MKSWLDLLFPECTIEDIIFDKDMMIVKAYQPKKKATCPRCQKQSHRVHSTYIRKPQDLPISGYFVRLSLKVRRFRCLNQACQQVTYAERWDQWLAPYAHQTTRIKQAFYHIGQVVGGEGGARLLTYLKMKASGATLIRLIRSWPMSDIQSPRVLGIDYWALCKGRTYGTIIVDRERVEVIALLPDRQAGLRQPGYVPSLMFK